MFSITERVTAMASEQIRTFERVPCMKKGTNRIALSKKSAFTHSKIKKRQASEGGTPFAHMRHELGISKWTRMNDALLYRTLGSDHVGTRQSDCRDPRFLH